MKDLAVNSREKSVRDFSALCKYLIINEIIIIKRAVTPGGVLRSPLFGNQ